MICLMTSESSNIQVYVVKLGNNIHTLEVQNKQLKLNKIKT